MGLASDREVNAPGRTAPLLMEPVGGFEAPRSLCNSELSVAGFIIVLVCLTKTKSRSGLPQARDSDDDNDKSEQSATIMLQARQTRRPLDDCH